MTYFWYWDNKNHHIGNESKFLCGLKNYGAEKKWSCVTGFLMGHIDNTKYSECPRCKILFQTIKKLAKEN